VKVNCGSLTETLLESELFGHEKGAFTGAIKRKLGRFELADKGTLFLDEVGDMTPNLQLKLLRVLQEQEFERVGGEETVRVDVRVISATNRGHQAGSRGGALSRGSLLPSTRGACHVSPLRERREDIPALVEHFIRKLGPRTNRASSASTTPRWRAWAPTTGPATCANWRMPSSSRWSLPTATASVWPLCPPFCARAPARPPWPFRRAT